MATTHKQASPATLNRVREILHQAALGNVKVTHAFQYATGHYKLLSRRQLQDLAADARLRASTAGAQFQAVRSGKIIPPKRLGH